MVAEAIIRRPVDVFMGKHPFVVVTSSMCHSALHTFQSNQKDNLALIFSFRAYLFCLVHSFWFFLRLLGIALLLHCLSSFCVPETRARVCVMCAHERTDQRDRRQSLGAVCPWHITSSNCHTSLPAPVIHQSLLWRIRTYLVWRVLYMLGSSAHTFRIGRHWFFYLWLMYFMCIPLSRTNAIKFTSQIDMVRRQIQMKVRRKRTRERGAIHRFRCDGIELSWNIEWKRKKSFRIKSLYWRRYWRALDLAFFSFFFFFFFYFSFILSLPRLLRLCFAHPFGVVAFPSTRF